MDTTGESSQEVTWQDVKYCGINSAITQHFSEIQAECHTSMAKVVTDLGTSGLSSLEPTLLCTLLLTACPAGLTAR